MIHLEMALMDPLTVLELLKPLRSGMEEVVPAHTLLTLLPPSPPTVL